MSGRLSSGVRSHLVAALLLLAVRAHAQQPLEIGLQNNVPAGQKPSVTMVAKQGINKLELVLTRTDDSAVFHVSHGPLKRGQKVTLAFGDGKAGRFHWTGKLDCVLAGGESFTNELTFDSITVGDMKVTYRRDKLDLDGHVLEFQLSRPAGKAELKVFAEDDTVIAEASKDYSKEPPGTWLAIPWKPTSAAAVFRLELHAVAADGVITNVRLSPWSIAVPHEEVLFETNQAIIRSSEEPKLDASYTKLQEAVTRARKADPKLAVRVFIAGHTDTVGKSDENRRLSTMRAKAIAAWFRDRGLPIPVVYAGFGEDAPKVKTADNVDEPRNRRVDYLIGLDEPVIARGVKADWHPL